MPTIINLTPYTVKLLNPFDGQQIAEFLSVDVARVKERVTDAYKIEVNGNPVRLANVDYDVTIGDLSFTTHNTLYIVELPVIQAATVEQRLRMIYPYPLVRNVKGQVIGCTGFGRISS